MPGEEAKEFYNYQASLCAALGAPARIQIIYTLAEKAFNVNQLAEVLGASQSTTSRHLKALREQGLLRTVRRGPIVEYRLNDYRLLEALELLKRVQVDRLIHRARVVKGADEASE